MTAYIRKSETDTVELDGEWIILNMQEYTVTTLNEVGGYCWTLLREKQTPGAIARAVMNEYDTQGETIQPDINVFLDHLIRCGLIQYEDER